jgi:hypothetical protein
MANKDPVYLAAKRTFDQEIEYGTTWEGEIVVMNEKQGNGIKYDTNNGVFTLEGNKALGGIVAYRVSAQLGWRNKLLSRGDPGYFPFGLFNYDTKEQVGPLAESLPSTRDCASSSGGFFDWIVPVWSIGRYCLRSMSPEGSLNVIRGDQCTFMNIVPLTTTGMSARRLRNQTISGGDWDFRNIIFDSALFNTGIEYSTKTGIFKLLGGKTYRITAQLGWIREGWLGKVPTFFTFEIVDSTSNEKIEPRAMAYTPGLYDGTYDNQPEIDFSSTDAGVLDVILTPLETREYRIKTGSTGRYADADYILRGDVNTFLNIVMLSDSISQKSYLSAGRFTSHTISGVWSGKIIKLHVKEQWGDIRYSPEHGVFTLFGGRTYRITAELCWFGARNPEFYPFGLFNYETNEQIGLFAEALSHNRITSNTAGGILDVILPVQNTGRYCLKMASYTLADSSSKCYFLGTYMNIVEI